MLNLPSVPVGGVATTYSGPSRVTTVLRQFHEPRRACPEAGCGSVLAAPPVITDLAAMETRRFSSRVQDPELVAALLLQPGQQFAVDLAYPGGRGRFGRADLLDVQAGLILVQVLPD
jgi:hypothetical protein